MLGEFDLSWKEDFKQQVSNHSEAEQLRAALKSLIDSRNEFAHGGSPSITLANIRTYFQKSRTMIEMIDAILG